jgi:F0F1-type ATP synthase delta subunit
MKVTITTAVELSVKQRETMEIALQKKHPVGRLTFAYKVDPNVLGGVKLMIGSRELDGTVRGRMNQIADRLSTQF